MTEQDYKRIASNFVPDESMRVRLKQNTLSYQSSPNVERRLSFRKPVIAAVLVCTFILVMTFGVPILQNAGKGRQEENSSGSAQPAPAFSGFLLTAYAANSSYTTLTPAFISGATATEMKPGVKIPMPDYTPLQSSVPGLPFIIGCRQSQGQTIAADKIKVSAESGSILTWDQTTGKVEDQGSVFECIPGTTVYWSPISDGTIATGNITITLTALKAQKEIGTQRMIISSVDDIKYSANLQ